MEKKEKNKIDLTREILTLEGNPIPKSKEDNWTVKKAILFAIDNSAEAEKKTGKQKYEMFKLAERIAADDTSLKSEEWTLIKDAVGITFIPSMVGFIWDVIEGDK
jgi:hypothetical protein